MILGHRDKCWPGRLSISKIIPKYTAMWVNMNQAISSQNLSNIEEKSYSSWSTLLCTKSRWLHHINNFLYCLSSDALEWGFPWSDHLYCHSMVRWKAGVQQMIFRIQMNLLPEWLESWYTAGNVRAISWRRIQWKEIREYCQVRVLNSNSHNWKPICMKSFTGDLLWIPVVKSECHDYEFHDQDYLSFNQNCAIGFLINWQMWN
jgi:hypothetical protein